MRFAWVGILLFPILIFPAEGKGEAIVVKRALQAEESLGRNLLVNPSLEEGREPSIPGWEGWGLGFQLDEEVLYKGKRSARCESNSPEREYGLGQVVVLNQEKPLPILAQCYSKAEDVSGAPDSGYSLYLDIDFVDGTHLWGRTANFSCGTHDWEMGRVWVFPEKPIKQVIVYGIFRGHTGKVWFADFALYQLEGVKVFDGVPVISEPLIAPAKETLTLRSADGWTLLLDRRTGQVVGKGNRRGGFYIRDVARDSDFRQPLGQVKVMKDGATWEAVDEELNLKLSVTYRLEEVKRGMYKGEGYIRVDGVIEDLEGKDRAVTLCFALPLDAEGWIWSRDIRQEERVEAGKTYINSIPVEAGATKSMSLYPLACLSGKEEGVAMAVPMDQPRLYRLSYNGEEKEFYISFDFSLLPDTRKFPSRADFHFIIYRMDPLWRMRSALQKYYDIFPQFFLKRVKREGIWMPFTDISTVEGFEDFHFAFQEGAPNPAFDEEHGIYSFIYVEPMSHWLPMPPEAPRTYQGAMEVLQKDLQGARGDYYRNMAIATLTSGIERVNGDLFCAVLKAPWCDGAVFLLNPDPDVPTTKDLPLNKAMVMLDGIERAFARVYTVMEGWSGYGNGYGIDEKVSRTGRRSVRCRSEGEGGEWGLQQTVVLNQKEPKPLIVKAWSKAEGVTGPEDGNYAIYVDLYYTDGTPQWALIAPFEVGTHDWQERELRIEPQKPIANLTVYLLFRRTHRGTVWFDDVSLTEEGSARNLLKNPGFEGRVVKGELDGTYLDSLEMGATELNFRREHFREADIPVVFERESKKPCQMLIFSTYEFAKEVGERMHKRGKLLFANAVLWKFAFPAHLLDVLGTEVNWLRGDRYRPDDDAVMNFRRAMCYRKPYCLLMNTNYEKFNSQLVEKYFKRCLFYAVFPGFFDEEAASKDPYWASPKKWYNRDRHLFKRYLPLIISLAQAGWEPITHAKTDNPHIYVERYGRARDRNLHFTLFNDGEKEINFQLAIDLKALGLKDKLEIRDLLEGKRMSYSLEEGQAIIQGELLPEDVLVLKISEAR